VYVWYQFWTLTNSLYFQPTHFISLSGTLQKWQFLQKIAEDVEYVEDNVDEVVNEVVSKVTV
jgi:hypothetical protein